MENQSQYLTIKEAAELLDVTPTTLRNWDKAGKLAAQRDPLNGYRLYSIHDVSKLLRERSASYRLKENETVSTLQPSLFSVLSTGKKPPTLDARALRLLVRQMSRTFRDSLGGGILERFEEISKLLYCKLYDERQRNHDPDYTSRFYGKNDDIENTYTRIAQLYTNAIALLPDVFTNGNHTLSQDKQAVTRIVELLQNISLSDIPIDVKGIVYEELVRNTFEKSENQQFFTPRTVVEFMVHFVDPTAQQMLCDPACGSGGFLIETANYINRNTANGPYHNLIGLEIDRRMAWVAQMNLIMHGNGQGSIHHLSGGGALAISPEVQTILPDNRLDLILTNPPFGSDFSETQHLSKYQLGKGKSSRRRGILFIERCIRWLKPGGRLGIIIDDSVLNGKSNQDVRHFILDTCLVEAVISLPEVTFMPYATAKSSILFLRKKVNLTESQPDIFMADVENVGRKANGDPLYTGHKDNQGRPILQNDLPGVVEAWQIFQAMGEKGLARFTPQVFVCTPTRFTDAQQLNPDIRFDVQFHHPSRETAERILRQSLYPTPKLAELVSVRNITTIPAIQDPDEIWNYIGLANITANTGEYTVSPILGSQLKSTVRAYTPGDILFAKLRPELRKIILIDEHEDDGYASSECLVLRTFLYTGQGKKYEVDNEYLVFVLRSDIVYGQLVYQATGVGRPRVSQSAILGLHIPLPPLNIQHEIVATYQLACNHQLECRTRSAVALREGAEAIQKAYFSATQRLCPS